MTYTSPFADSAAVQEIVSDLKSLSTKSVNIEEDVNKVKAEADNLANQYSSDFDILRQVPSFLSQFADNVRRQNNTARDVTTKIRSQFDDYILLLEAIETITTKDEAKDVVDAFNDDINTPNPLQATPLVGFQAVTKEFNYIWTIKNDESKHLADALGKATDIKKTVDELTAELKPVKDGVANVQAALKDYAGHIHN